MSHLSHESVHAEEIRQIWALFKETDRKFQETDKKFQETDREFQEIAIRFQETDRKFQETDKKFQKTDREFQEIAIRFQETDKKFQETDRKFQETDKKIERTDALLQKLFKQTDKKVEELTGKWGRFVEGLIAPGIERLFKKRNIEVNTVYQRVRRRKNGKEIEIDILAIDGQYAVLIEAKSTLGVDDVKEHLDRLDKFKSFFPEYADRNILGAVAGIVIDEGSDKFAYKSGLFVIAQSGESVKILNDGKFKPRQW